MTYLVTIGDATTEHETFDAACGYARNELMLGRRRDSERDRTP